jgi:dTDP-4-amino-4,6-dideoxygalactose transaminase
LWAQLQEAEEITKKRLDIWNQYHTALAIHEARGNLRRPIVPIETKHNAHMYYVLLNSLEERTKTIEKLKAVNINAVFHYVPLHNSPAGLKFGRINGALPVTEDLSDRLLRLPLWIGMNEVKTICDALFS